MNYNMTLEEKIKAFFKIEPDLKDNDLRLVTNVWATEMHPDKTLREFLKAMVKGLVSHPETIRRTRQRLQEKYPELRGNRYNQRLEKAKNYKQDWIKV